MQRADRILLSTALLFAALLVLARWDKNSAHAQAENSPLASAGLESELENLRVDLAAFRRGEETRLGSLRAHARTLCERWQRCEALDIAEYYAALDPRARQQGLADEQRGLELRARVTQAEHDGLVDESWALEREAILAGLEELAGSIPVFGDRVPRAQACALAARLRVEHLRTLDDPGDPARRRELELLREDLDQSLEGFVRAGMVRPRIELEWIRGAQAREEGELARAESELERCLDDARELGEKSWQAHALEQLHAVAQETGDTARMERWLDELAALESPELSWPVARSHAQQLVWDDRGAEAAEFLLAHPASGSAREVDEHALWLGHALLRAGHSDEALGCYLGIGPGSSLAWHAHLSRARVRLAQGHLAEALALLEAHPPARDASNEEQCAWSTLRGEIELADGHAALAIRDLEAALKSASREQARLFAEHESFETTNVLGEVLGLHAVELLARAQLESGDALEAACAIESAQANSLRSLRDPEARNARVSRGDLAAWARHFELGLATWIVGADESLVVLVAPDGSAHGARIAHGRRELQEAVRRLREALLAGDERKREHLAGELRAALLPSLLFEELLARTGVNASRLCLLLHGPLESLPVESFEDGAWITQSIVPIVLPGLPAHAPEAPWTQADAAHWRLLGNPRGAQGERLLPGAQAELDELARLDPSALCASDATFDRAHLLGALASGDCLHLATHVLRGESDALERYEDAGFELSGGERFTLRELAHARPRVPLAVLTACETGGGRFLDAEGLQGIARVFLESGTRNLLVTSWPVEDGWARAFALALHREIAGGARPSEAAAQARRALRAQGAPASEWAAFRLVGQD